jgi:hypothetical protein
MRKPLFEKAACKGDDPRHLGKAFQPCDRAMEQRVVENIDVGARGEVGIHGH